MTDEADKPLREMEAEEASFAEELLDAGGDQKAAPRRGASPLALILSGLALAGLVGLGVVGMQQFKALQAGVQSSQAGLGQDLDANRSQLQTASDRIEGLARTLDEQNAQQQQQAQQVNGLLGALEAERSRYERGRQETLQALNSLQKRMGRSTSRWMAAEADYLIRVANHRLQLEADPITALGALQAADERLRDTADPLWTPVREVLAEDIAKLKGLAPPDTVGLSARLAGMVKQIDQLKVKTLLLNQPAAQGEMDAGKPLDWEKLLADGWQGFRSLVVVRRHDQPVAAMLPPEQRFFLGQNLRLQLESARLALLRRDQELYDSVLATATDWLREYFETEDPATASLLQELAQLAQVKVRLDLPDISGSLVVLKQQVEQSRSAGEAEPTPTAAEGGQ